MESCGRLDSSKVPPCSLIVSIRGKEVAPRPAYRLVTIVYVSYLQESQSSPREFGRGFTVFTVRLTVQETTVKGVGGGGAEISPHENRTKVKERRNIWDVQKRKCPKRNGTARR